MDFIDRFNTDEWRTCEADKHTGKYNFLLFSNGSLSRFIEVKAFHF